MRRGLALVVTAVCVALIALVVIFPPDTWFGPRPVVVRGIAGSESSAFLSDPEVLDELRGKGFELYPAEPSGSFDIPARPDLDTFDYALSSSDPAGRQVQTLRGIPAVYSPFSSPMEIVTYPAVVDVLRRNGVVVAGPDGTPVLDIAKLADLVAQGRRWGDLLGNTVSATTREVLLSTTDPSSSNSGSMYLALASFALNGNQVVRGPADIAAVMPRLCPLLRDQGAKQPSTQNLFDQFLGGSVGSMPMALVYENQVLAAKAAGRWPADRVALLPSPTVQSQYTFVPLRDTTRALGPLLVDDPVIKQRAADLGFRPADPTVRPAGAGPLPDVVVPTPSFDALQALRAAVVGQCS